MLKIVKLAAIAAAGMMLAAPAFSQDKTAAKVNGAAIPQSRVDAMVKDATSQGQADSPELRKGLLDRAINIELLSQEAVKKGLDKQQEFLDQMELIRKSSLAGAYVQDYFKDHPVSEDALKQEYENLKSKLGGKEYKVSHILVASEEEANAIEGQLKKNAKFESLAKEKSQDPGSKTTGGDLGWSVPSNYVEPFAKAITELKKGQISKPVHTQFGWHVIKLVDERNLNVPPFEQVRDNLRQRMQQQAMQKMIADLRKNAKVEDAQ
jgi:peptidyl-prolyl cis-trans isomerase C